MAIVPGTRTRALVPKPTRQGCAAGLVTGVAAGASGADPDTFRDMESIPAAAPAGRPGEALAA